jgi:hypothetical protein
MILATLFVAAGSGTASADLIFELDQEFSGATPPAGPAPWLTAVVQNSGTDTVTLTLTSNLIDDEFVSEWNFNFDPTGDLDGLNFVQGSGPTAVVTTGLDAFQADGDGQYDINFVFPQAPPAVRFGAGATAVFTITGLGITESSFDFLSAPAGGHGPFKSAAHVQGIAPTGSNSGWVAPDGNIPLAVPEPATILSALMLLPLGLLAVRRRASGPKQA